MPKKRKVPPEYLKFKDEVEKLGLQVCIHIPGCHQQIAVSILHKNMCIWHNDSSLHKLNLDDFWKCRTYMEYKNACNQI